MSNLKVASGVILGSLGAFTATRVIDAVTAATVSAATDPLRTAAIGILGSSVAISGVGYAVGGKESGTVGRGLMYAGVGVLPVALVWSFAAAALDNPRNNPRGVFGRRAFSAFSFSGECPAILASRAL